jgi:hypothetical protein
MLDRLVGGTVFAEPDRIVGHHVNDAFAGERAKADRRAAIVGEDEECAGIRNDAAVQRHAVHRRGHAVLAHAIVDESAGIVGGGEYRHTLGLGVVGAGEVGGAADHFRHGRGQRFERRLRCGAGRSLFRCCGELLLHRTYRAGELILRQLAAKAALEFGTAGRRYRFETIVPGLVRRLARKACAAPHLTHLRRNGEGGLCPAESFARAFDFVGAEGRPVALLRTRLTRRAEADGGPTGDQRGPIARLGLLERLEDSLGIVAVDTRRRPARGFEALHLIHRIRKR